MGCHFTGLNVTPHIGFHGNISVKAGILRKQFDVSVPTQILVAAMAASNANTLVETFPL